MMELSPEQIAALNAAIDKRAQEQLNNFDRELDVVVNKLSTVGWTLPAELGIYAVKQLANTDELDDVNTFLRWYFTEDDYSYTKRMVEDILNSTIRDGLKRLVKECWQAFRAGLYAICANSLVSIIEGILSEYSEDKNEVKMMKVCQKKVDSFPADGSIIQKHTWISYNLFIRNLYQKSNFDDDEPEMINRHWLLHGRSKYELDEFDCIRLINAVQSLCMIVRKETRDEDEKLEDVNTSL